MPTSYALLSTYPPTQCGLATFSAALLSHLPAAGDSVAVVRVLYGGLDGQDITAVLGALRVPSIVVLHTVLARPTPRQRKILEEIISAATVVVTMTQMMSGHSASLAPQLLWPAVASAYRELVSTLTAAPVGVTA